jgi:hypothetical protein
VFPKEILWVGAKGGLLAEKHYYVMKDAIWLFQWLLLRQTGINECGEGIVNYGHPITRQQIQDDTGYGDWRIERWTDRLRRCEYIRTEKRGNDGLSFFVLAAKNKSKTKRNSQVLDPAKMLPPGSVVAAKMLPPRKNAATYVNENKTISLVGGFPIPKDLSYYNNTAAAKAAAVSTSFKEVLKSKQIQSPCLSEKQLQERMKLLRSQAEQIKAKAFA